MRRDSAPSRLRLDRPVSLVLGGGAVRGLAHVGVLDALTECGIEIREMTGTSVGALILSFYAAVGMDVPAIRAAGLSLRSRHLLSWALLRHASPGSIRRFGRAAGIIPEFMQRLAETGYAPLHHGVERIAVVAYDQVRGEEVVCHSSNPVLTLHDAVRGSVALPGLFPAWKCQAAGRQYRLQDGGVTNRLPVDVALRPPFQPQQVLVVDISSRPQDRERNRVKILEMRRRYPDIPIDVISPDTLGGSTVMYRSGYLPRLLDMGRRSAIEYLETVRTTARTA